MRDFDVCGPLPGPGVTVLEASAGTGKTFTIAALVARLVAEGVAPLSEILVVTFTRMATGSLRERVRDRLVLAEAGLGRFGEQGEPPPPDDGVLALLASGGSEVVAERRQRLADALSSFDTATITTTHGFCQAMLGALGAWGEVAPGTVLLEDTADLVEETVDDLLARYAVTVGPFPARRKEALGIATRAVDNPTAPLGPPADRSDKSTAGVRRRFASGVRAEVGRRLLEGQLLTYDDLLVRLARALADDERGPRARERLRDRYRVVLVDEFQDTDTVQWEVVRSTFAEGGTRLVLIGDPKQAVYSFRGADVYAYLKAARAAGPERRFTLGCNWRSDAPLLAAFDTLFEPLQFGHPDIVYRKPRAAGQHEAPGVEGIPRAEPLRFRALSTATAGLARTSTGLVQKDAAIRMVARDLACDVRALLAAAPKLVRDEPRPMGAGDIGVLVRTNRQALVVQAALRDLGIPVVVAGAQSVLATPAARQWLDLLQALDQPASRSAAAAAALTPFFGTTAEELALAHEHEWERLHARLHEWASLLTRYGVAALFWRITATEDLPARLLRYVDGERHLTDLAHVAELLHAAGPHLGTAALRTWLGRRTEEVAGEGDEAAQRSRRLDSDAEAVQVLTVHRAKGLEFPVVYCPYLWDAGWRERANEPVVFHDPGSEERMLDVGGEIGDRIYQTHYELSKAERRGEDLRHLYVALTRAKHQAIVWWARAQDCQRSALGRLLLSRDASGAVDQSGRPKEPRDAEVEAELRRLAGRSAGLISVEPCEEQVPGRLPSLAPVRGRELDVASFTRALDVSWRRSSYTSITSAAHERAYGAGEQLAGGGRGRTRGNGGDGTSDNGRGTGGRPGAPDAVVASEPERPGTTDEPAFFRLSAGVGPRLEAGAREAHAQAESSKPQSVPSLWAAVPGGADVGTLVHRALEGTDFASPTLDQECLAAASDVLTGPASPFVPTPEALARCMEAAILTPFGNAIPGARLADFSRADRLDELHFELPVAGGDEPTGEVLLDGIAAALARHTPVGHPLAGYAASLSSADLVGALRGYLTGSLDLVLRVRHEGGVRYFVVDYKTNWLGLPDEQLTTWHYRPAPLAEAMTAAHYPLQALLYMVALHRYLRWRQPGYDPSAHLGGAVYLFLRGMVGLGTPVVEGQVCGVFPWTASAELVVEASDLLAGPPRSRPGAARR